MDKKQNLSDSIFMKVTKDNGEEVKLPFITKLKGDIVFEKPPIMRRISMYKDGKKVAEWEEPVDDVLS